eukprot:gene4156-12481_t
MATALSHAPDETAAIMRGTVPTLWVVVIPELVTGKQIARKFWRLVNANLVKYLEFRREDRGEQKRRAAIDKWRNLQYLE